MTQNNYDVIIIGGGMSGAVPLRECFAKAACSVHGSPVGCERESASADFHELRQDFSPTDRRKEIQ